MVLSCWLPELRLSPFGFWVSRMMIEPMRQVAARAQVPALGNPLQCHRRFRSQLGGQLELLPIPLAPPGQVGFPLALPLQFRRQQPLGFGLSRFHHRLAVMPLAAFRERDGHILHV